jgi:mono/diheme cytochrome c family protein
MKNIILTVVAVIILSVLAGVFFIYSGTYNVAATSKDSGLMQWVLKTTREESIDRRADDVIPPAASALSNPQTLRVGFEHYDEMCVVCHGAPGIEPGEAREGLNPKPPLLAKVANKISMQELFWVIKHGIKMTGMPAWGPTHSDDKIWAMVAFVKTLPELSPAQYKAMQQQAAVSDHQHDNEHAHEHTQEHSH